MRNEKDRLAKLTTLTTLQIQKRHLRDCLKRQARLRFGVRITVLVLLTCAALIDYAKTYAQQATCKSSSPGAYTVTLCLSTPANGASLTGVASVVPSITVVGTNPGITRFEYALNGQYLLTAVAAPYSFALPSHYYVDGAYTVGRNGDDAG